MYAAALNIMRLKPGGKSNIMVVSLLSGPLLAGLRGGAET